MLDHLLPLLFRDFEYFDEADKENFGYIVRRRARSISSQVFTSSRTPPRPPRRNHNTCQVQDGVASRNKLKRCRELIDDGIDEPCEARCKSKRRRRKGSDDGNSKQSDVSRRLKRRREVIDDGNEERSDTKRHHTRSTTVEDREATACKKQKEISTFTKAVIEEKAHNDFVTPMKKKQEPQISAKKVAKKVKKKKKKDKMSQTTKVTADIKEKKMVKNERIVAPKRIPLQDVTHLYVNEHTRSYAYQQRQRFVAGLSTSVAIRFF